MGLLPLPDLLLLVFIRRRLQMLIVVVDFPVTIHMPLTDNLCRHDFSRNLIHTLMDDKRPVTDVVDDDIPKILRDFTVHVFKSTVIALSCLALSCSVVLCFLHFCVLSARADRQRKI